MQGFRTRFELLGFPWVGVEEAEFRFQGVGSGFGLGLFPQEPVTCERAWPLVS